ncbi:MAG: hypothetical protein ACHREM_32045, partial [Polyangiales bacterium]
ASGVRVGTVAHTCGNAGEAVVTIHNVYITRTAEERVSPPQTPCAGADLSATPEPTYHVNLEDLDIDGTGRNGTLTLNVPKLPPGSLPEVNGSVSSFDSSSSLAARLIYSSTSLAQDSIARAGRGVVVAYNESFDDGSLLTRSLPPGSYVATIVPGIASGNATRRIPFDVGNTAGQPTFEVFPLAHMVGTVSDPSGATFGLGTIELRPTSTPIDDTSVDQARARLAPLVSIVGGTALDPGVYDIVFHLPEPSAYPWIVMPNASVPEPIRSAPTFIVGTITPTLPVVMRGTVREPNGTAIAGATIQAKALRFAADGVTEIAAVEVGEATADSNGAYILRLPSSLTAAPVLASDAGTDAIADADAGD